ncbi:hypothetical protein [Frankia sp. Cr1]|uniref:hypothetical protein n=1 Tax=Frankia sp. Cr1 TaxID=3073931 RepID=UPI002AD46E1A|nr:hypothetical protein [Frankia sp. Cr1]
MDIAECHRFWDLQSRMVMVSTALLMTVVTTVANHVRSVDFVACPSGRLFVPKLLDLQSGVVGLGHAAGRARAEALLAGAATFGVAPSGSKIPTVE